MSEFDDDKTHKVKVLSRFSAIECISMKGATRLLVMFFGAILIAVVSAAPDRQTWDPICQDSQTFDSLYPAENREVAINSSGDRMNGVLFVAQGPGPHPTAVLLHGFPGNERNLDLAQAIRRSGWNVLTFQCRGAWGSEGAFSFSHMLEDVAAAIDFMQGPEGKSARCSPNQIVLIGHSVGGWAALLTAAKDSRIRAVASLACWNMGSASRTLTDSAAFAEDVAGTESSLLPLRGTSAEALTRERADHIEDWDLLNHVASLADKPILLIAGGRDDAAPITDHHIPLVTGLEAAGANKMTHVITDSDHAFSDKRIALTQAVLSWLNDLQW